MTIEEDKGLIFNAESNNYGTFVTSAICHWWLHKGHRDLKQARLYFSLGNHEDIEAVLVYLTHECIASLARVGVQYSHDVILHEANTISTRFSSLIRHDTLESNHKDVRQLFRTLGVRQEPRA